MPPPIAQRFSAVTQCRSRRHDASRRRAATAALGVNGVGRSRVMNSSQTKGEARPDDGQNGYSPVTTAVAADCPPSCPRRRSSRRHRLFKDRKFEDHLIRTGIYPANPKKKWRRAALPALPLYLFLERASRLRRIAARATGVLCSTIEVGTRSWWWRNLSLVYNLPERDSRNPDYPWRDSYL